MDYDVQDIFQPQQVTPELARYLMIAMPSRQKRREVDEDPPEDKWDELGDFA